MATAARARPAPDATDPAALAAWLAEELDAGPSSSRAPRAAAPPSAPGPPRGGAADLATLA